MKALKENKKDSFEFGTIIIIACLVTILIVGIVAR